MSDSVDTVRNFYEAITAGDVSAMRSLMAQEIEWITVMDFHITDKGPEEVIQNVFLPLMQEGESFSPAPSEFLVAGSTVCPWDVSPVYTERLTNVRIWHTHTCGISTMARLHAFASISTQLQSKKPAVPSSGQAVVLSTGLLADLS